MAKKHSIVVGLDIGTSKVCAVVGEMTDSGVEIIGVGSQLSHGLRKGVVINIETTVNSIKKAIAEAELMGACEIHTVFAGIAGSHIKGFNSHGVVAVKNKEVSQRDLDRVIDAAKAVAIPPDQEVLHILPQDYVVDEQDGIKDPLEMSGVRLEARVHIITGAVSSIQNIIKCCSRAGLNVADIALQPLASAEAVTTEEERELGLALVDMGAGTTDIAVFHEGAIRHSAVLGIGGGHVTGDIAAGLRTSLADAERIKLRCGRAKASLARGGETIEVPILSRKNTVDRSVSPQMLCSIIEPRLDEVFQMVRREIVKSGFEGMLPGGVVMTGGSMLLPGAIEMAEEVLEMPARLGLPMHVRGLLDVISSPIYATGVGLVLYGLKRQKPSYVRLRDDTVLAKVKHRMSDWLSDFF